MMVDAPAQCFSPDHIIRAGSSTGHFLLPGQNLRYVAVPAIPAYAIAGRHQIATGSRRPRTVRVWSRREILDQGRGLDSAAAHGADEIVTDHQRRRRSDASAAPAGLPHSPCRPRLCIRAGAHRRCCRPPPRRNARRCRSRSAASPARVPLGAPALDLGDHRSRRRRAPATGSSACGRGVPKCTMIASPMYLSTVPPWANAIRARATVKLAQQANERVRRETLRDRRKAHHIGEQAPPPAEPSAGPAPRPLVEELAHDVWREVARERRPFGLGRHLPAHQPARAPDRQRQDHGDEDEKDELVGTRFVMLTVLGSRKSTDHRLPRSARCPVRRAKWTEASSGRVATQRKPALHAAIEAMPVQSTSAGE